MNTKFSASSPELNANGDGGGSKDKLCKNMNKRNYANRAAHTTRSTVNTNKPGIGEVEAPRWGCTYVRFANEAGAFFTPKPRRLYSVQEFTRGSISCGHWVCN